MVWKLLRTNISAWQIAGYALANLVGLAIVLCAVRFYDDVQPAYAADDSFLSKDFMIISKRVSTFNSLGIGADGTRFAPSEVERLERQPWVRRVGAFEAAAFNVSANVEMAGHGGMSTYLFLETIPDDFIDIKPTDWNFDASDPDADVPVIMSKDYLTLYNFGFAASRGLPQISETLIGRIPLTLTLSGNGRTERRRARIVGFSSRLNTIAVPSAFMQWANGRYGDGTVADPSRLIIEVSRPGDPAIEAYMQRAGYDVAGDKADNSRASYFLTVATTLVIAIGAVISVLAFFILMLSIYLLLQKNRRKLRNLMLLGYSPWQVARPYFVLVGAVNAAVLCGALGLMWIASAWWQPRLAGIGVTAGAWWPSVVTGVAVMLALTAGNFAAIWRTVRRTF